ncbi:hypothetical protein BAY61_04560 [Prauserella marina]|uniref:Uncharacterized protein n=1 Tax=Prauserella marina TaxID=530584 RepID=A0A222VKG1_9PSEU|nr:hypothetical protein [Prauserella marina]ASR34387.1 hypothetical protein BAY61_04560 [Prauserella marina]PWV70572.1 hypothetical protein DES30_11519 [Prauserella marina]SDE02998.1 hypothetical protein SAMN05421630_11820 [Prauserella marina]
MSASGNDPNPDTGWWFNTRTGEVEHGNLSRGIDRLGPYPDEATARSALEIARERTKRADAADAEWNEGDDR